MNKKVCIKDLSFYLSEETLYEREVLRTYLEKNDYILVEEAILSDYVIIFTFGYFQDIYDMTLGYINFLFKNQYSGKIIVYGEIVGIEESLNKINGIELIKVNEEYKFGEILKGEKLDYNKINSKNINHNNIYGCEDFAYNHGNGKRFYLMVGRGCIHNCTYCIIKRSVKLKSKNLENILDEVKYAILNNYKEIVLLGEDIGSYGIDIGLDFSILFNSISDLLENKDIKIYIHYMEPSIFIKYFELIKKNIGKLSFIDLGIQSFNDRILLDMNRNYKVKDVIDLILKIRKLNKDIFIGNQLIYGFPGETFEEFKKNILYSKRKDLYNINTYNPFSYMKYNVKIDKTKVLSKEEMGKRVYILTKLAGKSDSNIHISWSIGGKSIRNLDLILTT